jgi:hypothetical protein
MCLSNPNREDSRVVVCNMHRGDEKCIQNFIAVTLGYILYITHLKTDILYQKANQCEVLKQQRLADCMYNIAYLFCE